MPALDGEVAMHDERAVAWSLGEVAYLAWLAVIALAWVVFPMVLVALEL